MSLGGYTTPAQAQEIVHAFERYRQTGIAPYPNCYNSTKALDIVARAYSLCGLIVPHKANGIPREPIDSNALADW